MANAVRFSARLSQNGFKEIFARDQARAKKLLAGLQPHGPAATQRRTGAAASSSGGSINVTDSGVTYTASVGVGSPATDYTLLIDTGKQSVVIEGRWS